MRKKEREVKTIEEIITIINKCQIITVALFDKQYPYAIPLNFLFEKEKDKLAFYFHSAKEGKKIDLISKNEHCGFTLYNDLRVSLFEKAERTTNYYESVIGEGKITEIKDQVAKRETIEKMLRRYGYKKEIEISSEALDKTFIGKITVDSISGKANREVNI